MESMKILVEKPDQRGAFSVDVAQSLIESSRKDQKGCFRFSIDRLNDAGEGRTRTLKH
jgi:hypothetical protein